MEKVDLEKEWGLGLPKNETEDEASSSDPKGTENAFKRQPTDEMVDPALAQNHKSKKHDPPTHHWASERRTGHIRRSFIFPENVRHERLVARLNQGLLKILIPKAEPTELKRKKIEIDVLNFY